MFEQQFLLSDLSEIVCYVDLTYEAIPCFKAQLLIERGKVWKTEMSLFRRMKLSKWINSRKNVCKNRTHKSANHPSNVHRKSTVLWTIRRFCVRHLIIQVFGWMITSMCNSSSRRFIRHLLICPHECANPKRIGKYRDWFKAVHLDGFHMLCNQTSFSLHSE